jgi:aspartyl-tRNA synthetase
MAFERTCGCGEVTLSQAGTPVTVAGWVQRRRDHGGVVFIDLRDRSGVVQVVVRPESGAAFAAAQAVRTEWVLRARGEVRPREPALVNPKLATGALEVWAQSLEVLSAAARLPFSPTDADVDETVRLRHRYVDLRRPELLANLALRHRLAQAARGYLNRQGFLEIETPTLTRSTPEGARDYLVPSRLRPGTFYALPQSPQLFKQLLMVGGVERYYQLARCYRDEDLRADRQPEFTQIDLEMSFVDREDVWAVVEGLMAAIVRDTVGQELALPLPRLTWRQAMDRYGTDKPDLRLEVAAEDGADTVRPLAPRLGPFGAAVLSEPEVRTLSLPAGVALPRSVLDGLAQAARDAGAGGLGMVRRDASGVRHNFGQAAEEAAAALLADRLGLAEGGTALCVAGRTEVCWAAVAALRAALAPRLPAPAADRLAFVWVTDFPLFERAADGTLTSSHHPFTAPAEPDVADLLAGPTPERALRMASQAYDIVLNGVEIGSGSIRIHRQDVQEAVFAVLGIGPEEARRRFGFLLEGLAAGAPPHGGMAPGVDRLAMLLAGASSLREVVAFPKTAGGFDPLTDAPAPVDDRQLAELGLVAARPAGRAVT